jgi:hypothetical protein
VNNLRLLTHWPWGQFEFVCGFATVLLALGMPGMDFIRRYFGYSPDDGDGSLEIAILVVSLIVVLALTIWLFNRR